MQGYFRTIPSIILVFAVNKIMPKYGLQVMTHVIDREQACKDKLYTVYSNQKVGCEC